MPRGRRKSAPETFNEQIEKIDVQIRNHQNRIDTLRVKKNDLLEQKKKSEVEMIYQKIQESGKPIDEVLKMFEQK